VTKTSQQRHAMVNVTSVRQLVSSDGTDSIVSRHFIWFISMGLNIAGSRKHSLECHLYVSKCTSISLQQAY